MKDRSDWLSMVRLSKRVWGKGCHKGWEIHVFLSNRGFVIDFTRQKARVYIAVFIATKGSNIGVRGIQQVICVRIVQGIVRPRKCEWGIGFWKWNIQLARGRGKAVCRIWNRRAWLHPFVREPEISWNGNWRSRMNHVMRIICEL